MERDYVNSSNLASIGYDTDSNTLEVQFKHVWLFDTCGKDKL